MYAAGKEIIQIGIEFFTTVVGMVRRYSALGDFKNALKFANMALPLAPDANNKTFLQGMIDKLKTGKDIN